MLRDADRNLTCRQCGRQFVFTRGEQEFYEQKGFTLPGRCPECRSIKSNQVHPLVCYRCGGELERESPAYCTACMASAHLELELEIKQSQKEAEEMRSGLLLAESQKTELAESIRQKEQVIAEMKLKIKSLSQDLESAHQFHAALGWSQQSISEIQERLEALGHGQNKINQRMLQLAERMHEMSESTGLWKAIKRSFTGTFVDERAQREDTR